MSALAVLLAAAAAAGSGPATVGAADVAPLFGSGPAAQALADLEGGRAAEAAAGFAAIPRAEARFLESQALLAAGEPGTAVERLAGLEGQLPAIADRITWLRAQALQRAGKLAEAADACGRVPPGSLLRAEAVLAQARLLAQLGEPLAALEVLGPLLGQGAPDDPSRPDASAEALLAAAALRGADPAAARGDLLQCWAAHPLAPAAPRCREALRALPPPHDAAPPPGDALRRAEALLEANRNRAAIAELAPLVALLDASGPPADACRARLALGRGHRKERLYLKALELLRPAVAACPDAPGRARALHALASASAVAAPGEAVERYRQLAREYPDNPVADDALFFAADLMSRDGRATEARAALADLAERYPRGDYRAEALFRSAWLAWRGGEPAEALAILERSQREHEEADAYEFGRAAYWRARILAARRAKGDAAQARKLWAMLAERHPADYYGLLARARLAESRGAPQPSPRPGTGPEGFRFAPGGLAADPHFRAGLLLLRMGLAKAASEELRSVDRILLVPGEPQGADPLLLVSELLHRAGDHRAAHNLVRTVGRPLLRRPPEGEALRVWRIAYPPAWRDEVLRWAPGAGVPPDLLQAIMREESALDPMAVSAAGAVGLTQLMVPTAQALARRLRLPRAPTAADLMDGPLNIRLGASHLGEVLRRFGGSAPLAVAAYNIGERTVRGWVSERGALPLDEFVEEIPVQETRGYVKRVLRSYAAYRLLYGGPRDAPVSLGQKLPLAR